MASLAVRSIILIVVPACLISGCATDPYETNEVDNQAEAGSTQVTVLSVLRWSDYKDSLAPGFKYSGTLALSDAVPNTLSLEDDLKEAFLAKLAVATPQILSSKSSTTSGSTGQPTINNFSSSSSTQPGSVTNVPPDNNSVLGQSTNPGAYAGITAKSAISIDPMLKFQAATALNEEVQLLNAQINSPVFAQYDVFIVRAQITTVPFARNEPYDTYCSFGIFPTDLPNTSGVVPLIKATSTISTDSAAPEQTTSSTTSPEKVAINPTIIPLLVSDDLENSIEAKSLEQMQQFILGISAMLYGVGANADFNEFSDHLRSILGNNTNSLLTVSSLSPNTLTVRLGAMYQAGAHYAMIPRNHFITFLLLKKKDDLTRNYQIGIHTSLRNANSGEELPAKAVPDETVAKAISTALPPPIFNLTLSQEITLKNDLLHFVEINQYEQFHIKLLADLDKFMVKSPPVADDLRPLEPFLWAQLISLRLQSANCVAQLELPERKKISTPPTNAAALLTDDPASNSTLVLDGFSNLYADPELSASLYIKRLTKNTLAAVVSPGATPGTLSATVTGTLSQDIPKTTFNEPVGANFNESVTPNPSLGGSVSGTNVVTLANAPGANTVTATGVNQALSGSLYANVHESLQGPIDSLTSSASLTENSTNTVVLPASSINVLGGGKTLQATFPSLKTWLHESAKADGTSSDSIYLKISQGTNDVFTPVPPPEGYMVLYTTKDATPPKQSYSLSASAPQIIVDNTGKGVLELTFKKGDGDVPPGTKVNVTLTGAAIDLSASSNIVSLANPPLAANAVFSGLTTTGVTLTSDATLTLHLMNMLPGSSVVVNATEVQPAAPATSDNQVTKETNIPYPMSTLPVMMIPSFPNR